MSHPSIESDKTITMLQTNILELCKRSFLPVHWHAFDSW